MLNSLYLTNPLVLLKMHFLPAILPWLYKEVVTHKFKQLTATVLFFESGGSTSFGPGLDKVFLLTNTDVRAFSSKDGVNEHSAAFGSD